MSKKPGISFDDLAVRHSEHVQELQSQLKDMEGVLSGYRKEHGKLESFFGNLKLAIKPVVPLPSLSVPKSEKVSSPCVAVMQISDGHMGSVQMADEIEGFGEFSPEICEARQVDFVNRFVEWIFMHRQSYTINEVAVLVTGDLISGDIHQELSVTNAFPVPVQCVRAAEVLTKQIGLVAPHFEKITVHFIVEDNHARLTRKPQAKEAGYNSLNYVVGKIAEIYLSKHDNVEFNLYPQYEKVVRVSTLQYLISHGHGLVGWMGIPWYSITRHVGKEATARMQVIMGDITRAKDVGFHKYVFGHWHTPFNHPLYSCSGSVQGTDAFDHKMGRHADPSQSAWIIHPVKGEFNRINFTL